MAAFLAVGCTTTGTTTYSNPDFAGRKFQRVLVYTTNFDDLGARRQMVDAFVAELRKNRIAAYSALAIWPIDANWPIDPNTAIKDARLAENGIDSVLVIQVDAYKSAKPGMVGYVPYGTFTVRLVDVETKRDAWVDQAQTSGGGTTTGFNTMVASFTDKAAGDLVAANVLMTAPQPGR